MAAMIPVMPSTDISNIGEKLVYEALRDQLPDDWVVRYHYPFCWLHNGFLRDSEIDFVVVAPGRGLMFLEVKSSYGFDCDRGIWYRIKKDGRREAAVNPWAQAQRGKHRVVEKIAKMKFGKKRKEEFPGSFGHMVVYPRGRCFGKYPESVARETIIEKGGMKDLAAAFDANFKLWGDKERSARFSKSVMQEVCAFLEDNCRFIQVEAADVDVDEREIEELTIAQYGAFQKVLTNPRVIVSGPAGSGKTMIAEWTTNVFAQEGKRVLFLCYNTVLETWLKQRQEDHDRQGTVEVRSYFSLCREWAMKAGMSYNVSHMEPDLFYANTAPDIFVDALGRLECSKDKYDVVVVDEAQDFHENWWISVQLLLKDPDAGGLFVFRDPGQSGVYGHGSSYPDAGMMTYSLYENCRNTVNINQYSRKIVEREIPSFELSPKGIPPVIVTDVENHGHRALAVKNAVSQLLEEGFLPSQIAILSSFSVQNEKSSLRRLKDGVQGRMVCGGAKHVDEWLQGNVIWGSTIKSFKGLEADCIVITDLYVPDEMTLSVDDLYVACTRAKHRLYLIPMNEAGGDYLREKYSFL